MVVAGDANLDVGGGPCGTPSFMSPEQAQGARDRFDERTDVFGLGAVLYNILTGVPPFDGADVATCLDRATACVVTFPPGDPTAPLPIGLCRIVKRAMARDPNDRYQSVSELKKDVEMTLRGFPLSAELFAAGTRIVVEGDPGDCAYIIVRGTCVAYKTVGGQKVVLRRLTAGSVFGGDGGALGRRSHRYRRGDRRGSGQDRPPPTARGEPRPAHLVRSVRPRAGRAIQGA